jgi:predicted transcriptional regulator
MTLRIINPLDLMRLHLDMTITNFCEKANIQYDTYYRHTHHKRQPSVKSITKYVELAKKYNYNLTPGSFFDYYETLKNNACNCETDSI